MAYKYFAIASLFFAFTLIGSGTVNAQENDSLIQQRIRYQQYVFVPQSFASSASTMPVNVKDFQLRVTNDSVVASLPYFGRSDTPQFGGASQDDGIKFTSTNFEYTAVPKKKGKWEITIQPKDSKGIRIFLTVFNNGDAQMDVTSPGRQSMFYKGYVW